MQARPSVAIIVLNWNGLEDTRVCARSVAAQTYRPVRVYLVDNGSSDGSAAALRAEFPGFIHIAHRVNLGFARGSNVTMARALKEGADYILLLNNDTEVEPTFLERLVEAAEANGRIGIVVPKIYFYDRPDELWYAGSRIDLMHPLLFKHIGEGEKDFGQYDTPGEPAFATACCMLVRNSLIHDVGMLDPTYGFYCEDVDLSLRARRAGWRLYYEPRARIWHRVNRSIRRAEVEPLYYAARNVGVVARRHQGFLRSLPIICRAAVWAWHEAAFGTV
jgi:GT2 family glycosyltransferase